jgi:hypothetical protein
MSKKVGPSGDYWFLKLGALKVNVLCNFIFAFPFPPDEIFVKLMIGLHK